MILGMLANYAVHKTVVSCIKGVATKSGCEVIDKFVIPAGMFIMGSMVGYSAEEYVDKRVKDAKEEVTKMIEKAKAENKNETVVENVFEKAEDKEEEKNG